jgi:hypothetical protein
MAFLLPSRLWNCYNAALTAFSLSVDELSQAQPTEFSQSIRECQEANLRCKAARLAWENHLEEHNCDRPPAES